MTGYQSKKAAALDEEGMYLVHQTDHQGKPMTYWGGVDFDIKTTPPAAQPEQERTWVESTGNEWFEWWRVSKVADETEAEIDFADFLIIAQAVVDKLKEDNK